VNDTTTHLNSLTTWCHRLEKKYGNCSTHSGQDEVLQWVMNPTLSTDKNLKKNTLRNGLAVLEL